MLLRPVLEAVADGLVRGRPHLVRPPRLEQLALAEREPHVRPEVLVRRAEEDVDVPAGDVDRPVRPVVDGVGPGERAGAVRKLDDPADVGRRPDRVRGDRKGDDARPLARAGARGRPGRASGRRARSTKRTTIPRSCASSSQGETFASWSSFVTSTSSPRSSVRARQRVSRKLSEVMVGPNATSSGWQLRNRPAATRAALDELDGAHARLVGGADVRVVLAQVARDRVDHLVRALRAARPVEERKRPVESGRSLPDCLDVESDRAHGPSLDRLDVVRPDSYGEGRAAPTNAERGRVLRPLLRVAGRRHRRGDEDRAHALRDRDVVSGELLRALFEDRLDTREPEAA